MITLITDLKIEIVKYVPEKDRYKLFTVSKAMREAFNKESIWNLILPPGYKDVSNPFKFYGRYQGFVRYIKREMVQKQVLQIPRSEAETKIIEIDHNSFFNMETNGLIRIDHINERAKKLINTYPTAKIEVSNNYLLVLVKNILLKIWDCKGVQVFKKTNVLMASLHENRIAYIFDDNLYLYDLALKVRTLVTKNKIKLVGDFYLNRDKIVNNTPDEKANIINLEGVVERHQPTPVKGDYLVTREAAGLKVERLSDLSLVKRYNNEKIKKFEINDEYLTLFYDEQICEVFNLKLDKLVYSSKFFPTVVRIHEFMFCLKDNSDFLFFSAISGEHLRTSRVSASDSPYLTGEVAATRKGDILIELAVDGFHRYSLEEFKNPSGRCVVM